MTGKPKPAQSVHRDQMIYINPASGAGQAQKKKKVA